MKRGREVEEAIRGRESEVIRREVRGPQARRGPAAEGLAGGSGVGQMRQGALYPAQDDRSAQWPFIAAPFPLACPFAKPPTIFLTPSTPFTAASLTPLAIPLTA